MNQNILLTHSDLSKEKSIALALTYQFVTPYTSLVTVVVDDQSTTTTTTTRSSSGGVPQSTLPPQSQSSGFLTTTAVYSTRAGASSSSNAFDYSGFYGANRGSGRLAVASSAGRIVRNALLAIVSLLALLVVWGETNWMKTCSCRTLFFFCLFFVPLFLCFCICICICFFFLLHNRIY